MILTTARCLQAVLGGSVSANQPEVTGAYIGWNQQGMQTTPAPIEVALNGNTDVTILAAPTRNPVSEVLHLGIYNKDTAAVTVTVKTDVAAGGGTEYILVKKTLQVGETLYWSRPSGWQIF